MAKKSAKGDRSDPKQNKSLAIRLILKKMPKAKASEVAEAVNKEYGHGISVNMVYMIKTKANMRKDGQPGKARASKAESPMTSAALWVEAITIARKLLKATGSVANATALLKAVEG